jgi:peptidoglycan/xylan/chitin deacetylase (PgdA/CDA1 family)
MSASLTIVVYHYVRPLKDSAYPEIKGLELSDFEEQLDYIGKHYQVVSAAQVIEAACGREVLPDFPVLLTFDDGYSDHYKYVFPALKNRQMSGVFFPSGGAVLDRAMLDVNKVQFLLASGVATKSIVDFIENEVNLESKNLNLLPLKAYREEYWRPNRFDPSDISYIKRMLQSALPHALRARIAEELFRCHVSSDTLGFADDLYLSAQDLRRMADGGMEIGSHGYSHFWLESLTLEDQRVDIDASLSFLKKVGVECDPFLFCFPFGSYNQDTLTILKERGCAAAFTTHSALVDLLRNDLLELPRLDTNDLPKTRNALPSRNNI